MPTETLPAKSLVGAQVSAETTPPLKPPNSAGTFESRTVILHSRLVSMAKPWAAEETSAMLADLSPLAGSMSLLKDMPSSWKRFW